MKNINVAVVGLGFMGITHIKAWLKVPGARVATICDAVRLPVDGDFSSISGNLGTNEPLKLDMTQTKATKSLEEVLNDPTIDVVDLCVPTQAHAKLAIMALKAGKNVLCEKPMARTSAQAREIVEAAKAAKGYFMPAQCIRFWPEWLWVKQAIDAGTYGKVLAARIRRVSEPPGWSKEFLDGARSGGALLDLHIHDTDFVQYCFGRPAAVCSTGFSALSGAVDYVSTIYQFQSGVSVTAEGTWAMDQGHGFNMAYTFIFEHATVDYDCSRGTEALRVFQKGQPKRVIATTGGDGYVGELSHFAECIRAGHPPTMATAQDGLSAVEICEAEELSINTGRIVTL
jgi:predicted dehydrogenase